MKKVVLCLICIILFCFTSYGANGWEQQSNGKWKYKDSEGNYVQSDWVLIDISEGNTVGHAYYYLDDNGYMVTGDFEVDGEYYHFDSNGKRDKKYTEAEWNQSHAEQDDEEGSDDEGGSGGGGSSSHTDDDNNDDDSDYDSGIGFDEDIETYQEPDYDEDDLPIFDFKGKSSNYNAMDITDHSGSVKRDFDITYQMKSEALLKQKYYVTKPSGYTN